MTKKKLPLVTRSSFPVCSQMLFAVFEERPSSVLQNAGCSVQLPPCTGKHDPHNKMVLLGRSLHIYSNLNGYDYEYSKSFRMVLLRITPPQPKPSQRQLITATGRCLGREWRMLKGRWVGGALLGHCWS